MFHRVFVSSTFVDLRSHREAVQNAIRQLGAVDISMEHFGARDARPKAECMRLITEESDSFIGIYAHRYGFVPKGASKAITEAEFDKATAAKLPRFAYIVDDEAPWNPKLIEDGEAKARLAQFKARLNATLITRRFATPDQLAAGVAADLGRHLATLNLKHVAPGGKSPVSSPQSVQEWNEFRDSVYAGHRDLFLVHTLAPSSQPGQRFDIFIYLQKHRSAEMKEVAFAEFFLGKYWNNRVFKVRNSGGLIGISTSAYGEFLCVCRVTFKDKSQITLHRYIDFGSFTPTAI